MIDQDQLGELRDWCFGWRATLNSDLSDTYVPGEGDNPIAMIIGEAPGAQEEVKHRPFVGRAGIVLRDLMAIAGLFAQPRGGTMEPNCWLTNVVKFRPPRNRTPTNNEIDVFRHSLNMEWRAIGKPSLIIPVGGVALQAVLGKKASIIRHCGHRFGRHGSKGTYVTVWPMMHPSWVLRTNSKRVEALVEMDWERLGRWIRMRDVLAGNYDE